MRAKLQFRLRSKLVHVDSRGSQLSIRNILSSSLTSVPEAKLIQPTEGLREPSIGGEVDSEGTRSTSTSSSTNRRLSAGEEELSLGRKLSEASHLRLRTATSDSTLGDLVGGGQRGMVVLAFFRQFGCLLCRKFASELGQVTQLLSKLDIKVFGVGTGNVRSVKSFQEETGFRSDIFIDSSAKAYKVFSCRRGIRTGMSNSRTKDAHRLAQSQGYQMHTTDGHMFQLGGVFVVYQGEIIWEHREEYAGHSPDYVQLLEACGVPSDLVRDFKFSHPIPTEPVAPIVESDFVFSAGNGKRSTASAPMLGRAHQSPSQVLRFA